MKNVLITLNGMIFNSEADAREYYGERFESAILAPAVIDEDGEIVSN